jgi:hypothetical protein
MDVFPTAKHLCSWAGLTPTNNESAGKKKSVRISRAGCYIKPLLVQCATAVVKSEKHPEIRNRYLRIKKRRGHKRAIIAIARMILTAIYNILKKKEPYNADLYRKADVLPVNREITVEQAILLAKTQGYRIRAASWLLIDKIFFKSSTNGLLCCALFLYSCLQVTVSDLTSLCIFSIYYIILHRNKYSFNHQFHLYFGVLVLT